MHEKILGFHVHILRIENKGLFVGVVGRGTLDFQSSYWSLENPLR